MYLHYYNYYYYYLQGAVQMLAVIGCVEQRAQCLAEPSQCNLPKITLETALGILGSPTSPPSVIGSGDRPTGPVRGYL